MINTFLELLTFTKNRVNFIDEDEQVDMILKEALNYAYTTISKQFKTIQTAYLPIIEGVAVLPEDCLEVISIDPALTGSDKIKGANIMTQHEGTLAVSYVGTIDPLQKDTDVLDIPQQYIYPISTYACSVYYGFKKKLDLADFHFSQYMQTLEELKVADEYGVNNQIQNFYGDMVNE